jgi:hypothetical protein
MSLYTPRLAAYFGPYVPPMCHWRLVEIYEEEEPYLESKSCFEGKKA